MSKRYNKPIPFGWYAVEYSEDLKVGEVKAVKYFGKELVLFRTESGEAALLDAYCPHLGAHLGHGGIVKGESVSCPFHAWKFDGTGMLTDIPYAKRIPPKVKDKPCIRSYPVVERNQMIWAWYHPKEEVAPMWEVDVIPEVGAEGWTEFRKFDWNIKSIIQETGENAADIAHFVTVHNVPFMPESEVEMKGHRRSTIFDAQTHAVEEDGSVNHTGDNLEAARLESYNVGPGQTYQKFMRLFEVVLMATVTPVDDQNIHLRFNFTLPTAQSDMKKIYADGFVQELVHQVEQDMPIWENKVYKPTPILCDGDGPIGQYRKWFNQFYDEQELEEANRKDELLATA